MKTKLRELDDSVLRVRAKHFKYGTEIRQMWVVEMKVGSKWLTMADDSEKEPGRHATREEAEKALELHREAMNAVNEK